MTKGQVVCLAAPCRRFPETVRRPPGAPVGIRPIARSSHFASRQVHLTGGRSVRTVAATARRWRRCRGWQEHMRDTCITTPQISQNKLVSPGPLTNVSPCSHPGQAVMAGIVSIVAKQGNGQHASLGSVSGRKLSVGHLVLSTQFSGLPLQNYD